MKKQISSKDNLNLFFSAFLVIAYIVCAYFFINFANLYEISNPVLHTSIISLVLVVFGLLVFYATRVGEGKTVTRFSVLTLVFLVVPTLYIVLASIFTVLPLGQQIAENQLIAYMAAVALGYGIPYTFISGFETVSLNETEEENEVVEGGIEEEMLENEEEEIQEEAEDEVVVEGTAIIENVEEYTAEQDKTEIEE